MPFVNGFGPIELIVILIIALIVVGPGKLPDVGSALGKSIREFRKAASDVKESASLDPAPTPAAPGVPASAQAASAAVVLPPPTPAAPPVAFNADVAAVPAVSAPVVSAPADDAALATGAAAARIEPMAEVERTEWPAEVAPADEQPAASA